MLSFGSFRLAGLILVVAICSVGLGMIGLWIGGYPFGFMAIVGTMGLVGVAINDAIVVLDTELTPELIQEGRARNIVRSVQVARKEQGLHVSDRIELAFSGLSPELAESATTHASYIGEQTLATDVTVLEGEPDAGFGRSEAEIAGTKFVIALRS